MVNPGFLWDSHGLLWQLLGSLHFGGVQSVFHALPRGERRLRLPQLRNVRVAMRVAMRVARDGWISLVI